MSSDLIRQACSKLRKAMHDEEYQGEVEELLTSNLPGLQAGLLLLLDSVKDEWDKTGFRKAFTDPTIPNSPAEKGAVQLAQLILGPPETEEAA